MGSAGQGAERYYGQGSPEEQMHRREVGFKGVGGRAGAERYYGEGLPDKQLHRKGVGFMGLAGARVRNGFI